jgi:hypothetical protein
MLAGAAVAGVAAPVLAAAPAEAASYTPRPYRGEPYLPPAQRHLVSRFSYGLNRALVKEVRRQGGARRWFERQLSPSGISDKQAAVVNGWWPSLGKDTMTLWDREKSGVEDGWDWVLNYQRWLLNRRIRTRRQVLEVMTEFWENHFYVPATGMNHFIFRKPYGDLLRRHALSTFETLLQEATTHPAMLVYLDNAISTSKAINENLGRELLELHTVGVGAGYTEDEVKASARILTGWRVDVAKTWDTSYRPGDHATGPVSVLGFSDPNPDQDGRALTRRYLSYLAHHPATAARIARKLATKFVSDDPSQALVDHLAQVYLDNGTAIKPVLRALVDSPEFAAAAGAKVRDPGEDLVATYRALGITVLDPPSSGGDQHAANSMLWQSGMIGLTPFTWPRPDGTPMTNAAWSSPSRMMASFQVHFALAGGWYPSRGVRYRSRSSWIPRYPIRYDELVDYLSLRLLGRRSTPQLLQACCEVVGYRPSDRIVRGHRLITWDLPFVLSTILDSPAHLTR